MAYRDMALPKRRRFGRWQRRGRGDRRRRRRRGGGRSSLIDARLEGPGIGAADSGLRRLGQGGRRRLTDAIAAGEGEAQCEQQQRVGSRRIESHGSLPKNRMGGLHWYV